MKNNTISLQTRILRSLFLFLGLIFVYLNPVYGQNCYVRLSDVSGITPTQAQLDSLEYAACRLRDSLPTEFQSTFKVYDFGFYLHNETMVGGYPEAFQKAIDLAQAGSPYYLLFGKQTDKNGVYTRFWVKLKLPTNGQFSCMTQLQREVYQLRVEKATVNNFKSNNNEYLQYYEAEIAGIKELYKIVGEIKDCCVANKGGVVQRSAGCLGCSDSLARQNFELQGFEKVNLNISTAAFANINTAKVKDYSFHKVTIGGQTKYLGEIMENQVQEFNQWFSFNLLVTSYPSLCIDSISGSNIDAFKYKEDFNCQINFPSGEGLKPSDIKITWNKKVGSWIQPEAVGTIIKFIRCKIFVKLGISNEDCTTYFNNSPISPKNPISDFFDDYYFLPPPPGIPILDVKASLDQCFGKTCTSCTYYATLYIEQPVPGTRNLYTTGGGTGGSSGGGGSSYYYTGHTFLELIQVNASAVTSSKGIGFYPANRPNGNEEVKGYFYNEDNNSKFNIKIKFTVTLEQFSKIRETLDNIYVFYAAGYNNCTTAPVAALNKAGLNIPLTQRYQWPIGDIKGNPGDLGEDLRANNPQGGEFNSYTSLQNFISSTCQ